MEFSSPTYVRSYNGSDIRLHKINDVVYSGKQEVFLLELENEKNIKATGNHKILTKEGWREVRHLKLGIDEVMCDSGRKGNFFFSKVKQVTSQGVEDTYDIVCDEPNHNFSANDIIVHNSGKSVFGMQLAKLLDPNFTIDNVCMNATEFKLAVQKAKRGDAVLYDEAFTGLSSKRSLSEINKVIVELMMEMGQKNLKVIIILPTFFMLEKYVALFRTRCLFNVYKRRGQRGYWRFYGKKKKMSLYLLGKKFLSYSQPKSNRFGRFSNTYVVNEDAYRLKKKHAFEKKDRKTRNEKHQLQRDCLLWYLNKKFGISMAKISDMLLFFDIQVTREDISIITGEFEQDSLAEGIALPDQEFIDSLISSMIRKKELDLIKKREILTRNSKERSRMLEMKYERREELLKRAREQKEIQDKALNPEMGLENQALDTKIDINQASEEFLQE